MLVLVVDFIAVKLTEFKASFNLFRMILITVNK